MHVICCVFWTSSGDSECAVSIVQRLLLQLYESVHLLIPVHSFVRASKSHFSWLLVLAPGVPARMLNPESQTSVSMAIISSPSARSYVPHTHSSSASSGSILICVPWSLLGHFSQGLQCLWHVHTPLSTLIPSFEMVRVSLFYSSYLNTVIKMALNLDIILSHSFLYTSLKCVGCFSDWSHVIF